MVKFSHIKLLTDTTATWIYGFSKTHSYFSAHNPLPWVIQHGNCPRRICIRLDIIRATSYPCFCENSHPWMANFPLPDSDISAITLPSVIGKKKSSPPPSSNAVRRESAPDTPYHHQHHLCYTLHPQRQHYAVLDVLSLAWECVIPHCCLLMECRQ